MASKLRRVSVYLHNNKDCWGIRENKGIVFFGATFKSNTLVKFVGEDYFDGGWAYTLLSEGRLLFDKELTSWNS